MTEINFTMLAQNTNIDYVRQACVAAMSIKATNKHAKICLISNDTVPKKYQNLFDDIVEIPWGDHAEHETWKISNRWKIYHATPYEKTAIIDTDMLVLQDLTAWFEFLENYDLFYTSHVYSYRGEVINNTYYRKAFKKYNLPNLYSGFHYFKKSDLAHEFNTWLEMITNNWQQFYKQHAGGKIYQKTCSMDLSASIAAKILDCEKSITTQRASYPSFTHMKSRLQNWNYNLGDKWQDRVGAYLDQDLNLMIGNYMQSGIFHYTEKDFLNNRIENTYCKYLGI